MKLEQQLSHEEAMELSQMNLKNYYTEVYFHIDHKCWIVSIIGKKR